MTDTITHHASKVARITLAFWIMKICATTLGEIGGDQLSMTMHVGDAASTLLLLALSVVTLGLQLALGRFHPPI